MFPDMFEIFNQGEQRDEQGSDDPSPSSINSAGRFVPDRFFSVSVGGSILIGDKPNVTKIAKFSESINRLSAEGYNFALVLGGGKICRSYQAAAKALGANNYFLDELGIMVTRINATLLTQSVDNAYPRVLTNVSFVKRVLDIGKIPILGGQIPGFTTDAVAALIAEQMQGNFINLSNVDGVYSSDPKKSRSAKFYPELSYERLISIIQVVESKPGQNLVLDLPAALVLKRSRIPSLFVNGNDLENFEAAVRGQEFRGTVVNEEISEGEAKTTGKIVPRRRHELEEEEEYKDPDPDEIKF